MDTAEKAKLVVARIDWLTAEEGGRQSGPPAGWSYIAPARFDLAEEKWPEEAWSLCATRESAPAENRWVALVWFLVETAPFERLRRGNTFAFYEGSRVVARGVIIAEDPNA